MNSRFDNLNQGFNQVSKDIREVDGKALERSKAADVRMDELASTIFKL